MRKLLQNLFGLSKLPSRQPARRVRLAVEDCEPRILMTVGVFERVPLEHIFVPTTPPGHFASLSASDASGDDSPGTVFKGGALRVNYNIVLGNTVFLAPAQNQNQDQNQPPPPPPPPPPSPLDRVTLEAWQGAVKVADLGSFNPMTVANGLVNLANTPGLAGGAYTIKATAYFTNGSTATTTSATTMQVKTGDVRNGDFSGQTFFQQSLNGDGIVVHGNGGTDTLDLQIDRKLIASINGMAQNAFSPTAGGQAIYQGLAVDYVRLTNGREIYFTGIENLTVLGDPVLTQHLAFGGVVGGPQALKVPETIRLAVTANDPDFDEQWNLHATDVPDAWRFTKGSDQVLLVSLDTGAFLRVGDRGITHGIESERLIYDNSDDDNMTPPPGGVNRGHGHQAISVMIAAANDGKYHTGINWVSDVYVTDVYNGVNLQDAIEDALDYARDHGLRVVFQGGIQGNSWLTSGGSQSELESLISSYSSALYVIAAGNGGPGGNLNDPNFATSVSGVAKFQTNHSNVIAVGALQHTVSTVNGLENAGTVTLAGYSNRGSNLTMVAPTDSPATTFQSDVDGTRDFGGTSCANPNLAAMASLVWSVNPSLSGAQVRQILERTALDLGDAGRDNTFGAGLVDTGEAVRRAVALARDPALANLAFNPSGFRAVVGAALNHVLQPLDAMPVLDVMPVLNVVVPPPVEVAPTPPPVALLARVVKQKGLSVVKVFNGSTLQQTLKPFGKNAVKLQVALIDVNGDGVKDLVVTARVGGKLRKKVYSGATLSAVA